MMWRYWQLWQWCTFGLFMLVYPGVMIHFALENSPPGWEEYGWFLVVSPFFFFLLPVIILFRLIPRFVFHVYGFERSGSVYKVLGVPIFEYFLITRGTWMRMHMRRAGDSKGVESICRGSLAKWYRWGCANEGMHWGQITMTAPIAFWGLAGDAPYIFWIIMAVNIPYNLYPVMMMRYNRARIWRICKRIGISAEFGWYRGPQAE